MTIFVFKSHRQILLWEDRTFHYKIHFPLSSDQPVQNPAVANISKNNFQWFLCSGVSILNSEKKLILHFLEKKTNSTQVTTKLIEMTQVINYF